MMGSDKSQALRDCRAKVDALRKKIEILQAANTRLSKECSLLTEDRDRLIRTERRLKEAMETIKVSATILPPFGPTFSTTLGIASIAARALDHEKDEEDAP